MRSRLTVACGLLALWAVPSVEMAAQAEPISVEVAPFRSVQLRHGGHAILRYGTTQRVTFLKGSPDHTEVTVTSGNGLVIDKCRRKCARGYELEIEIVTPELAGVSVAQGGILQSRGSFPRQAGIDATVDNGGTVDIRSMSVGSITASVLSGGRILVRPLTAMSASVVEGGNITYWGDARVTQSIQHGGVITRGVPSEADQPLSELSPAIAPLHEMPPPAPIETRRNLRL